MLEIRGSAFRVAPRFENYFWWPARRLELKRSAECEAFSMCVIFFIAFRLLSVFILWRKSRFVL